MKNKLALLCFLCLSFTASIGQSKNLLPVELKPDSLKSGISSNIKIHGYLGSKIDLCINQRIIKHDLDELITPFRNRTETWCWQTEFWGKWILSAIAAYEYKQDPNLLAIIKKAVDELLSTQTPDGYIGNYADSTQLKSWDIWGRKYSLLGLLAYYEISDDKRALDASCKLADHLISQVGPGKVDIVKTGNYRGMPSSSMLEPMVFLYKYTNKQRYLDFAKYIVKQWETTDGPHLISKALNRVDVAERFPQPETWWSWDNGQKAYEMMSCYEGLLELYRLTGEASYLQAVEMAVQNIIEKEINCAGSGTAFECFYHGAEKQTEPTYHTMETCVTFTWMKLCFNLLRLTANPAYADQIEKTTYNALLASMKFDGSKIAKYSPLEGVRHDGEEQCGMHINCCNANGPRAFTLLPHVAVTSAANDIVVNLYAEMQGQVQLSKKNKVEFIINTDYPQSGNIEVTINPGRPELFGLLLRIPAWSVNTGIKVNGEPVQGIISGSYCKIARTWQAGDKVSIQLDMRGRLLDLNGYQAIARGPLLLARDSRFNDGFVDEAAVIQHNKGIINLLPSENKPEHVWLSFTAPMVLGSDLEGEFQKPRQVHFCDFSSAGNIWTSDSRYRVWIKRTLNVMNTEYKSY